MDQSDKELRRQNALAYWERRRIENASIGWHEMSTDDKSPLFDSYISTFFPEGQMCVPPSFITWDVRHATKLPCRSAEQLSYLEDLQRKCLTAIKRSHAGSDPWYVLENMYHPWYRLHFDEMPDHVDEWPVEVLPYGDPCYMLAPDFTSGIIAEVHESITVFGARLLTAVQEDLPLVLTEIVDSDLGGLT